MIEPEPRQTLSYVKSLLGARGLRPKNKLGQNFLIDLNLVDLLIQSAELTRDDLVLEVGTGTGSLTQRLAAEAGMVVSVEVDGAVHAMACEALGEKPNVRLMHIDALRSKNELHPALIKALDEARTRSGCSRFKLIANLPYAVATPVIANLLIRDEPMDRLVVTVQWEIAERMTAKPGTHAYGSLAVLVKSLAEIEIVRRLPPSVFWPRPQVESAIVRIDPSHAKRAAVGDVKQFRAFLRDLYVHRRKNLRGALSGWPTGRREKTDVDRLLEQLGIAGTDRAEKLTIEQHLQLCRAFAATSESHG